MIKAKIPQLIAARLRSGYTQRALGRVTGLSSGFLSQLETGDRDPGPDTAKRLCDVLDATFDDLFEIPSSRPDAKRHLAEGDEGDSHSSHATRTA